MKEAKDNFSEGSASYKKFRPVYPPELYNYIYTHVAKYKSAWDCGTGNGQVADVLSSRFDQVIATDLSEQQISQASVKPNVTYKVHRAEQPFFQNEKFDLITVGQAAHWFDLSTFFQNVSNHLNHHGLLALWGYGLLRCADANIEGAIDHFDKSMVGPYWDEERKHIDESYSRMHHDAVELIDSSEHHFIKVKWSSDRLRSYLKTWSSVRHYINKNNTNPVDLLFDQFSCLSFKGLHSFQFPIFIKLFKKKICSV